MRVDINLTCENEDHATALMVYHLKLAAAYWECTHDDRGRRANEVIRVEMLDDNWKNAASAFVDVLCTGYENDEDTA